ncbi:MAG: hypothetical protein MJE68_16445 [Proteobacteria bacterium]|nr:hypothetical protein [Pseudomonadota bacterium]
METESLNASEYPQWIPPLNIPGATAATLFVAIRDMGEIWAGVKNNLHKGLLFG